MNHRANINHRGKISELFYEICLKKNVFNFFLNLEDDIHRKRIIFQDQKSRWTLDGRWEG